MTDICTCGEPVGNGLDHRRCYLIDAIEADREFGGDGEGEWVP